MKSYIEKDEELGITHEYFTVDSLYYETHDLTATPDGFIEHTNIQWFGKKEQCIPTDGVDIVPRPPCLVWQVIDEENSTAEFKMMKPIKWVPCTQNTAETIRDWILLRDKATGLEKK